MDITKLLDIVSSKSLYFTRADFFDDIFEGSIAKLTLAARTRYYELPGQQYPEARSRYTLRFIKNKI